MNPAVRSLPSFFGQFAREILLNSGQFALFYILMIFSHEGMGYFGDPAHTVLLGTLLAQTTLLALWGEKPWIRFFGSLLAPMIYMLMEFREGTSFVLDSAHMFFWFFSMFTGLLQALSLASKTQRPKVVLSFLLTFINVFIFLLVYFYFDTHLNLNQLAASGAITADEAVRRTGIDRIFESLPGFLADPAHIFVTLGGALLAVSLGLGRSDVLHLKEKITRLFGQYVDKSVRDEIIRTEQGLSRVQSVCVLFSDIRGFTTISETHSPEAVTGMLNRYFTRWESIVDKRGGVVDKYIGDAIMVIFGLSGGDDGCVSAVSSAVEMLDCLESVKSGLTAAGLPAPRDIGVGINYGACIVGDIGSENRKNWTVVGDTVNVSSRLESACKKLERRLIVSDSVHSRLPDELKARFKLLGRLIVKGKSEGIIAHGLSPDR